MCWPQAEGRRTRDVSKSAPPAVITSANFAATREIRSRVGDLCSEFHNKNHVRNDFAGSSRDTGCPGVPWGGLIELAG